MAGSKAVMAVGCILLLFLCVVSCLAQTDPVIHVSYSIREEEKDKFIGSLISDARLDQLFPADLPRLEFAFLPQSDTYVRYFVLEGSTGQLWTNGSLDRDQPSLCPQSSVCNFWLDVGIMKPPQNFRIIRVNITLEDINDNSPVFTDDKFSLTISEAVVPVVSFVIPPADDKDAGLFGIQRYELKSNSSKFELQVSTEDGGLDPRLLLKTKLDREMTSVYNMELIAYDGGQPAKSSIMSIEVEVRDANDNNPVFTQPSYSIAVPENYPLQDTLIQVSASDPDLGLNGEIVYKFASQTLSLYSELFGLNNKTGEVYLKKALDYEVTSMYQLRVVAEDQGPDSLPAHTKVTIHIEDINDHPPQMTVGAVGGGSLIIPENTDSGFTVAHVSVEDQDEGKSGQVFCQLDSDDFRLESVYQNTLYRIVSASSFDREERAQYVADLVCQDKGDPPLRNRQQITINIGDENDNSPIFTQQVYFGRIKENGSVAFAFLTVNATDLDSGLNGQVQYQLHPDAQNLVRVDANTGVVSTNTVFDRERMSKFEFHVLAVDRADQTRSAMATVQLAIEDINDEAPVFAQSSYNFGTSEGEGQLVEIGRVSAMDADLPPYNSFVFSLGHHGNQQNTFHIDEIMGRITTRTVLDREYRNAYHLVVIATNTEFPHLSSSVSVTVEVEDKNDNAPMISFPDKDNNSLQVSSDTPRGYLFTTIQATDADVEENGRLIFLIAKGNEDNIFDIDPLSGGMSANVDLNNVNERHYELLIMVKDQGNPQKAAVASLYLTINTTLAFIWSGGEGDYGGIQPSAGGNSDSEDDSSGPLGFHQKVIVILACVTAVLVTILVVAIFWVRHKQRQRIKETYKYMCRVDMTQRLPVGQSAGPEIGDMGDGDTSKESCEIRLHRSGPDSNTSYPLIQPQKTHLTLEDLQKAQWNRQPSLQSMTHQRTAPPPASHSFHSPRGATAAVPPRSSNGNKMEVQQLLQLLKRDTDAESTSGSSAEMSNTDSGRGPSEEGGEGHAGRSNRKSAPLNRTPDGQEKEPGSSEREVPPPRPPRAASLGQQPHRTATSKPAITPTSITYNPNKQLSYRNPQGHQCHNPEGLCQCQGHTSSDSPSVNHTPHSGYSGHPSSSSGAVPGTAKGLRLTPQFTTFGHLPPPASAELSVSNNGSDTEDMSDGSTTSGSFVLDLDNADLRAVDV